MLWKEVSLIFMKRQLSSLDLHFLVMELEALKDSRIDKIYQPEKTVLMFSLHKANLGKKLLRICVGQSIFAAETKEDYGETLGFGMLLRKHLDGHFLSEISQLKPERIIKLGFNIKDENKYLYIEFFGKGNAILCDSHNVIINALEHHEFRERSIKPKLKYTYPIMDFNMFDLKNNELAELMKNSKKESVVVALATELGLGGLYSEELCLMSNVDKNLNPKNIDEKQAQQLQDSINSLLNNKTEPYAVLDADNSLIDFIPFGLNFYKNSKKTKFETFNDAVRHFYSQFREIKETEQDKQIKSLQRIIGQQKQTIEELGKEGHELRQKGELIYHNYGLIKDVLDELSKASKKFSWKEIKEKLKGHKLIKEINEKDRKAVVEI